MESSEDGEKERLIDVENTIFVAVGKNVKRSRSTLEWAIQSFATVSGKKMKKKKKICLIHVHQPTHMVAFTDGKLSANKLKHQAVRAFRDHERQKMHELLDQYLLILAHEGVEADKVWIEMDNIEKGIIKIIVQHNIKWLVMGAAADKYYAKKMAELKSNKAIFVCKQAPFTCHIWFPCKGYLIYTRRCRKDETDKQTMLPLLLPNPDVGTEQLEFLSPNALVSWQKSIVRFSKPKSEFVALIAKSVSHFIIELSCIRNTQGLILQQNCPHAEKDSNERDSRERYLSSQRSLPIIWPRKKGVDSLKSSMSLPYEEVNTEVHETSEINDKLPQAMVDAETANREAFEESVKRWKAEEDAMEAIHQAKALESACAKEMSQRKEMEEELAREKQEADTVKNQCEAYMEELQMVREQKPILERQVAESSCTVKELEEKIISAVGLLISLKEKRDQMQIQHERAIREVNKLSILVKGDPSSLGKPQFLTFTFSEIIEATHNFDPSWKIGEGINGSVYQGVLHHLHIAIKMLPSYGSQSDMEFEHEVEALSRVRHPNLVTLIGICPESRSLIYEYLQNGSLEDRLACKGKTPALSWQTRTQIAIEICSALIFLHSNKPSIVHGNLKPTKVLLGVNFVSKLSDLGIFCLVQKDKNPSGTTTLCNTANSKVISEYTDPELAETGELTPESDVYSYGIILLRLITGRPVFGVVKDVKCALETGNFNVVLDTSAGDWPLDQAKQLAYLALRCCEKNSYDRPDLVSEIWSVLEPMKTSCNASTSNMHSKEHRRVPSHFVCPIFQEVMKDPHIAADGFTYEAEAIEGWLNSGHNTSPMTNLKLSHCDLIPNYALHYAIQEWQQHI